MRKVSEFFVLLHNPERKIKRKLFSDEMRFVFAHIGPRFTAEERGQVESFESASRTHIFTLIIEMFIVERFSPSRYLSNRKL